MQAEGKKKITVDDEDHGNAEMAFEYPPRDYVRPDGNCEMLVTVLDPGIRDFAVAFPKGSKLR